MIPTLRPFALGAALLLVLAACKKEEQAAPPPPEVGVISATPQTVPLQRDLVGRLAPFRSSMEVNVSITDASNQILFDNVTFTTFQKVDGNSGRANVATSSVAMNQTLPHTVRPREVKGCETCHTLVDAQGRVENEHIMAETFGLGAGRSPYVGDWATSHTIRHNAQAKRVLGS